VPGEQGVVTGTKRRDAGPFAERTPVLTAKRFPETSLRFRGRIPLLRPERIHASDVVMENEDAVLESGPFFRPYRQHRIVNRPSTA